MAARTMLGMIATMEGQRGPAQENFERVIDLDPRAPIAANNLAWMYAERGEKLDLALQLAQSAVRELPKSAGSARHARLGLLQAEDGKPGDYRIPRDDCHGGGQSHLSLPSRVGVCPGREPGRG